MNQENEAGKHSEPAVKKLDEKTSNSIRKSQIITKISDVVRELVDNSVDAVASTIKVLLEDFGLTKIEVRDTGFGIDQSDFTLAFTGGHTSKLKDNQHLSCHKKYGFRGEALASISAMANVTVTTKTHDEAQGRKYILNKDGQIISESKAAVGTGTTITIRDLFANFPVRKKWITDKNRKLAELKEIEIFLKTIAIANPRIHLSLYHDGNLSWTKPSVTSIDQALVTVLGVITAKKMTKCGPVHIYDEDDDSAAGRKGTMELFVPRKPVDYKTMSYTNHKLTMLIVNRRRVYIRPLEKIIQRYCAAVSEKPAPADNHRFPVSVLSITVPPKEVDFNLEMDKTKVLLTSQDEIAERLEEMLKKFYEVDLSITNASSSQKSNKSSNKSEIDKQKSNKENSLCDPESSHFTPVKNPKDILITSPVLAKDAIEEMPCQKEKTILAFLESIPTASEANFSRSPIKNQHSVPTHKTIIPCVLRDTSKPGASSSSIVEADANLKKTLALVHAENAGIKPSNAIFSTNKSTTVSNFNVDFSLDLLDTQPPPEKKSRFDEIDRDKWVQGRLEGKSGMIENVAIVRGHMGIDARSCSIPVGSSSTNINLDFQTPCITSQRSAGVSTSRSSFPPNSRIQTSGLPSYNNFLGRSQNRQKQSNLSQSSQRGRMVTLDSFKNWGRKCPSENNVSQIGSSTINKISCNDRQTGLIEKLVENPDARGVKPNVPSEIPIGVVPNSVQDYLKKKMHVSHIDAGLSRTVNSKNFFTSSQIEPEEIRPRLPKLIGVLPGTSLYLAKIDGYLGVFNPSNLMEMFPEFRLKYSGSTINLAASSNMAMDRISSLLVDFVSEGSIQNEQKNKIFHVLTDLDVVEFEPPAFSTQC